MPDFRAETFAQANGADLAVPTNRSSPAIFDLDMDDNKDLLTGNTEGELLFYSNMGSNDDPVFGDYELVESDGVQIDLEGTPRSRPFLCDWTGDGLVDVIVGSGDGTVRLYQALCEDTDGDGYEADSCGGQDCDDGDPAVNPDATEGPQGDPTCNDGVDNDCDGLVDTDLECRGCWIRALLW